MLLLAAFLGIASGFLAMATLDIPSDPVAGFMACYAVSWCAFAVAGMAVVRKPPSDRRTLILIFLGAAVLRYLAWRFPVVLETDGHRYMWDGWLVSRGFNPYQFAPGEILRRSDDPDEGKLYPEEDLYSEAERETLAEIRASLEDPVIRMHLRRVNHPHIPTCYPPVTEIAFGLSGLVAPGSLWVWKAAIALLDLGIAGLTLLLLLELGLPPAWFLLYAWNPLPIKEYANTGHFDPLATAFLLLSLLLLLRRSAGLAGASLGLAISSKLYPLVLVPVLARRLGARGLATLVLAIAVSWIPFAGLGPATFRGFVAFARDWEFNSGFFALLLSLMEALPLPGGKLSLLWEPGTAGRPDVYFHFTLDGFRWAKLVTGVLYAGVLLAIVRLPDREDRSLVERCLLALAALFLLSPVADPWYLPWCLPLAATLASPSLMLLSGTVSIYYLYFLEYRYLPGVRFLEYLPVYAVMLREAQAWRARLAGEAPVADTKEGCAVSQG